MFGPFTSLPIFTKPGKRSNNPYVELLLICGPGTQKTRISLKVGSKFGKNLELGPIRDTLTKITFLRRAMESKFRRAGNAM